MKQMTVLNRKLNDVWIQRAFFLLMCVLFFGIGPFALLLMGICHTCLWLSWTFGRQETPFPKERRVLHTLFVLVYVGLGITILIEAFGPSRYDAAFGFLMILLLIGPPLGIWYYVLSERELRWYRRAERASPSPGPVYEIGA